MYLSFYIIYDTKADYKCSYIKIVIVQIPFKSQWNRVLRRKAQLQQPYRLRLVTYPNILIKITSNGEK